MAHLAKYTLNSAQALFHHNLRHKDRLGEYVSFGKSKIDVSKTHLNYRLDKNDDPNEFIKKRLSEVKVQKRTDVKVYCSWVLTVPHDLPAEKHREFFESAYRFFEQDYGSKNIVMASVHLDETTPHMHLGFIPIVKEKKNQKKLGQEKVSAKELTTRSYLKTFHTRLQKAVETDLGCKVSILLDDAEEKRDYVPLDRLKKETRLAAAELEETKSNLEIAKIGLEQYSAMLKDAKDDLQKLKDEHDKLAESTTVKVDFELPKPERLEMAGSYSERVSAHYKKTVEPVLSTLSVKAQRFDEERKKVAELSGENTLLRSRLETEKAEHQKTKEELKSSKKSYEQLCQGAYNFLINHFPKLSKLSMKDITLQLRKLGQKALEQKQTQIQRPTPTKNPGLDR